MEIKVSVILPVYNAAKNLDSCMNSLLEQTLQEIEIICIDDGSKDNSLELLNGYSKKDSRVRVFHQENRGAGAARNLGLLRAKGEYLSIVDADDFFQLTMLEKAYVEAKRVEADYLVFGCEMYDGVTKQYSSGQYAICKELLPMQMPFSPEDVEKDLFRLFIGWSWDKLIKKTTVDQYHLSFQEQRTSNDLLFVFGALLQSRRITVLNDVLAYHRSEKGSLSVTREKSWQCFYYALLGLRAKLKEWSLYERYEQDFINYCIHFSLWNLHTLAEPTRSLLYEKLHSEWFHELGVHLFSKEYFYNRMEYNEYRRIIRFPKERKESSLLHAFRLLYSNGLSYCYKRLLERINTSQTHR